MAKLFLGNGCVNDFSRTLSAHVWEALIPDSAITVFSGGTEGVLSPHVTFIVKDSKPTGLVAAVGRSRPFKPHEVGTIEQAKAVAETVKSLAKGTGEDGIALDTINLVLIKCPLLTSEKIEATRAEGKTVVTDDTYESMARSRYASALGIAVALGEMDESKMSEAFDSKHGTQYWSNRASCSSGAELDDCHILILGSDSKSSTNETGQLKAVSGFMADAIDAQSIMAMLDQVKQEKGKVIQAFVKAEADPSGLVRGYRHTMKTDSDIQSTRHARAAVGGLLAGLLGDPAVYVSGGAEGQGPSGGGSLCLVYQCN